MIPLAEFRKLANATLRPTKNKLVSYSGHKIVPSGETVLKIKNMDVTFHIAEHVEPILGRDMCEQLGLLMRNVNSVNKTWNCDDALREYDDVFRGLACIQSGAHLHVDPNVTPSVDPPRRIPHAVREQVKAELDRMESLDVICKQVEPTPRVTSMTIVRKPNKIRVCIDPTKLNKAIRRRPHPTRTIEEVAASLSQSTVFSCLDANSGYWQIALDDDSSKLCTFNSQWGRYRFKRLPFGITTSGDICTRCRKSSEQWRA